MIGCRQQCSKQAGMPRENQRGASHERSHDVGSRQTTQPSCSALQLGSRRTLEALEECVDQLVFASKVTIGSGRGVAGTRDDATQGKVLDRAHRELILGGTQETLARAFRSSTRRHARMVVM